MSSIHDSPWIKASRSGAQGNCVELRGHDDAVEVRDTKANGSGPSLRLSSVQFSAWLDGAKRGDFDHLK